MSFPCADDYLNCFRLYGEDALKTMYLDPEDGRYEFLFERILRLLVQQSEFNFDIPRPFVVTAKRYLEGDPKTRSQMENPENRNFMLSDLYDFIKLSRLEQKRALS